MLEQEKSVRSPPPEQEGVTEAICAELTLTPISLSHCPFQGGGVRETGLKLSLGRREGWGEGVLRSGFISHYPTLI